MSQGPVDNWNPWDVLRNRSQTRPVLAASVLPNARGVWAQSERPPTDPADQDPNRIGQMQRIQTNIPRGRVANGRQSERIPTLAPANPMSGERSVPPSVFASTVQEGIGTATYAYAASADRRSSDMSMSSSSSASTAPEWDAIHAVNRLGQARIQTLRERRNSLRAWETPRGLEVPPPPEMSERRSPGMWSNQSLPENRVVTEQTAQNNRTEMTAEQAVAAAVPAPRSAPVVARSNPQPDAGGGDERTTYLQRTGPVIPVFHEGTMDEMRKVVTEFVG